MIRIVVMGAAVLALTAIDARAQGSGTYIGFVTAHAGTVRGGDLSESRAAVGASVAVHEDTGWGAEIDFGHTSDVQAGRQVLDVTSWMVNAAWARPAGLIRPFGTGGIGVLQVNGCDSPCNIEARTFDLGVTVGGGAYVALSDLAALRGDVRYFWSSADHADLGRPDNFNYWRASFGVTFYVGADPVTIATHHEFANLSHLPKRPRCPRSRRRRPRTAADRPRISAISSAKSWHAP